MSDGNIISYMPWQFWGKWALVLSVVSVFYLIFIIKVPLFNADLFINIDLGRIFLNPDTDWGITWKTSEGHPVYLIHYIGIVFQEYFYQIFGLAGPVILTLGGALLASTIILKWILLNNLPRYVALIISLVFLLDPIFVQSYTIGRLDSWVIVVCMGVCFILRNSIRNPEFGQSEIPTRLAISGALSVVSFFLWPSAVFLFPLIIYELISLSSSFKSEMKPWRKVYFSFGYFTLGGVIAFVLLIIPIYPQILVQFEEIIKTWQINLQNDQMVSNQVFYIRYFESFKELLRMLKFSPFLTLFAIIGVFKEKKFGFFIAFLMAALLMVGTVVYLQRVLYLLPYLVVMTTYLFQYKKNSQFFKFQSLKPYALTILLIWSVGLSIGVYSIFSYQRMKDDEEELLYKTGESMLTVGTPKILTPYELYFYGRSKGWKMYNPYTALGAEKFSFEQMELQLPIVDYAILDDSSLSGDLTNQLIQEGFLYKGEFNVYNTTRLPFNGITTNSIRLRNLYHIFKQPYGPYHLFAREKKD